MIPKTDYSWKLRERNPGPIEESVMILFASCSEFFRKAIITKSLTVNCQGIVIYFAVRDCLCGIIDVVYRTVPTDPNQTSEKNPLERNTS